LVVLTRANASTLHHATIESGIQNVLDILEDHISGAAEVHDANDIVITVDTAVNWADGADWCTTATVKVDDAIETHVVAKLASIGATSGAHRLGVFTSSYQSGAGVPVLAAGPLFARLESMRDGANIYGSVLTSWPSGDGAANAAAPISTQLAKVVLDLARSQSHTDQGVLRLGLRGTGFALASWQALGATSLYSLCTGLNAATGTYDGAAFIGAKAAGALSAGTVRSQLDELDARPTTSYYQHPTPNASTSPTYTNSGTTFTQITFVVFGSPFGEEVLVGDVVEIRFTATAAATAMDGVVALFTQQPSDGSPVEITGARQLVATGTTVPIGISATFKVTEAGVLTVTAQGAKKAIGGTVTIVESYRLECVRVRA
jgi:hypothetical protein